MQDMEPDAEADDEPMPSPSSVPLDELAELPPPPSPDVGAVQTNKVKQMAARKKKLAEERGGGDEDNASTITSITVAVHVDGTGTNTTYDGPVNAALDEEHVVQAVFQQTNNISLTKSNVSAIGGILKNATGTPYTSMLAKANKKNRNWLKSMVVTPDDSSDVVCAKVAEWISAHLIEGPFADAAMEDYKREGRVTLRLFIDGRRDCDGNVILVTVKIEGHGGIGAQPELSLCIAVAEETKENLRRYVRPLLKDYFALELIGLKVYDTLVPVFCCIVSDGKMLGLLTDSAPYNSRQPSACSCPLCLIQKQHYNLLGSARINNPATNVLPYKFEIATRVFFDPLHAGLRLGESIVNNLATKLNINTQSGRILWNQHCATAGIKCDPVETSKDGSTKKYMLPSLPLTKLFRLLAHFPSCTSGGRQCPV
jgi:hypothetical protein